MYRVIVIILEYRYVQLQPYAVTMDIGEGTARRNAYIGLCVTS